jgi:hypothetical protein
VSSTANILAINSIWALILDRLGIAERSNAATNRGFPLRIPARQCEHPMPARNIVVVPDLDDWTEECSRRGSLGAVRHQARHRERGFD